MSIRVASLHLYPIKGCAGIDVEAIRITPDGLVEGDRAAMIVRQADGLFITQRQVARLATLRPTIRSAGLLRLAVDGLPDLNVVRPVDPKPITVTVWDDTFVADDAGDAPAGWLSGFLGEPVRLALLRSPTGRVVDPFWTDGTSRRTGFADLAPALLANAASLEDLNRRRRERGLDDVPMSRFRPNIVVSGGEPFAEDHWTELHGSAVSLRCIKPCARCKVTEIDQTTGQVMADGVLATLASFRDQVNRAGKRGVMFGQNVVFDVDGGSHLAVGDLLRPA